MATIYVVIENGTPYPMVYTTFASATATVKEKHREILKEDTSDPSCSDVDVPENTNTGITYLYIEKGIHIYIYELPIIS